MASLAMRALGGLLLLAAALKMYGLAVEPVGRAGIFSEPWVQTLIVEWEIALGIWLVWGVNRALAWLAATATFLAFAGFSFWQGWIGQTSCGCFGAIRVNPWAAMGIDLVVLTILAGNRERAVSCESKREITRSLHRVIFGALGVLACLGVFAGIGTIAFGSPAAALAYLRGDRLTVEPSLIDVGDGFVGEQKRVVVQVRNWTDKAIRIVGGTSDCSCVVTKDLPVSIAPGEQGPLTVAMQLKGPPGQFTRWAILFTDDERFSTFRYRLTGRSFRFSSDQELPRE